MPLNLEGRGAQRASLTGSDVRKRTPSDLTSFSYFFEAREIRTRIGVEGKAPGAGDGI